jgi:hypothetical protein
MPAATQGWEYLDVPFDAGIGPLDAQVEAHVRVGWDLVLVAPPRYGSLTLVMHFRRPARSPLDFPRNQP